jgi:hypothetical protein
LIAGERSIQYISLDLTSIEDFVRAGGQDAGTLLDVSSRLAHA